jgi:hypothetical protein
MEKKVRFFEIDKTTVPTKKLPMVENVQFLVPKGYKKLFLKLCKEQKTNPTDKLRNYYIEELQMAGKLKTNKKNNKE